MGRKKKDNDNNILEELNKKEVWNTTDKGIFRKLKIWVEFRNKIIKERKCCEACGYSRHMHLHHIHLSDKAVDYSNLSGDRFKVMCQGCHRNFHRIFTSYTRKKDPVKPDPRIENLLNEFFILG